MEDDPNFIPLSRLENNPAVSDSLVIKIKIIDEACVGIGNGCATADSLVDLKPSSPLEQSIRVCNIRGLVETTAEADPIFADLTKFEAPSFFACPNGKGVCGYIGFAIQRVISTED